MSQLVILLRPNGDGSSGEGERAALDNVTMNVLDHLNTNTCWSQIDNAA